MLIDWQEIFWIIAPILGVILVFIGYGAKKDEEKKAREDTTPKKEGKRINQKDLNFFQYLHLVYFIRAGLRPASTFMFLLFGFLPGMGIYGACVDYFTPLLKFEEYQTDVGIVKQVNIAKRGRDSLWLEREDGSLKKYYIGIDSRKKEKELLEDKKIKIYYQNKWHVLHFEDGIYIVEMDGKIVKGKRFIDDYDKLVQLEKEEINDVIFWSIWNGIFLLWMFYFNYKEKPIHRLNRIRKLHGRQMAM